VYKLAIKAIAMGGVVAASLESLFNPTKPFGVEDHLNIPADEEFTSEIFDLAPTFVRPIADRCPIVLGRKGAGKTTILAGYQGGKALGRRSDKLNTLENGDIVVPVTAWQHFHDMVLNVYRHSHDKSLADAFPAEAASLYELITPELIEQNWDLVIWEEVLRAFWDAALEGGAMFKRRPGLHAKSVLEEYFNPSGMDSRVGLSEQAAQLYNRARECVLELIAAEGIGCYVLLDNMDKYPVRNPYFEKVIGGFLKCLNNFSHNNPGIQIVYCLPEELEAFLREQSTNILKDFTNAYRIRWSVIDLLCMAAHRYKIFVRLQGDRSFLSELNSFDLRHRDGSPNRRGVVAFFDRLLPDRFFNRNKCEEQALPYIVRHTQLLPRHLLLLLNKIASESHAVTGGWRKFEASVIHEKVAEAEKDIADQVLHPYRLLYGGFLSQLARALKDLPPVFTYKELQAIGNRFNLAGELDNIDRAYALLYKMGIFGKLTADSTKEFLQFKNGKTTLDRNVASYVYATFHFCEEGEKSFNTEGVFCFHPVFSDAYDVVGKGEGCRFFVYPDRVDQFGKVDPIK
jgi:hypothetical protein